MKHLVTLILFGSSLVIVQGTRAKSLITETWQARVNDVSAGTCNRPTPESVAHVDLPKPYMAVSTPDGCWVFTSVSSPDGGVAVLKRAEGEITLLHTIPTGTEGYLAGMVITHDGKLLIAAGRGGIVFLDVVRTIEGRRDAVVGVLSYDRSATSVEVKVTSDDRYLFVSDEGPQTITVIDLEKARTSSFSSTAVVGRIPVGFVPHGLTLSRDQKLLYSTGMQAARVSDSWPAECTREGQGQKDLVNPQGALVLVDVERAKTDPAGAVVAMVPAGCSPVRLASSPKGDFIYVTARNSNALLVFDTEKLVLDRKRARVATVPVGVAPVGVDVADSGRLIFVANSNRFLGKPDERQTVTVIDAARTTEGADAVLGTVPTGAFPRNVRATADGRTILVANYSSNTLQLIDVTRQPWSVK